MRHIVLLLLVLFCVLIPAQESTEGSSVIQNIRTAVNDGVVLLSWKSSQPLPLQVLRNTSPISHSSLGKSRIVGEVAAGHNLFTDVVDAPGTYYYAVVTLSTNIFASSTIEPYRNATISATTIKTVSPEVQAAAFVRNIRATEHQQSIHLEFTPSKPDRQLAIYRSTSPLTSESSLASAQHIATIDSNLSLYIDSPTVVGNYYYGIYDTTLIEKNRIFIISGENTLAEPIFSMKDLITMRAGKRNIAPSIDPMQEYIAIANANVAALPEFQMKDIPIYLEPKDSEPLSVETENAIRNISITRNQTPKYLPEPILLEEDIINTRLSAALLAFRTGNYTETVLRLEKLIEENALVSESDLTLAYFYLGQSYYWTNRDNNALMYLIRAQEDDSLYIYTEQYINAILTSELTSS